MREIQISFQENSVFVNYRFWERLMAELLCPFMVSWRMFRSLTIGVELQWYLRSSDNLYYSTSRAMRHTKIILLYNVLLVVPKPWVRWREWNAPATSAGLTSSLKKAAWNLVSSCFFVCLFWSFVPNNASLFLKMSLMLSIMSLFTTRKKTSVCERRRRWTVTRNIPKILPKLKIK